MKFPPVKTAVIGCGMISDTYLQNLSETFSIIDLVGCADAIPERARQQAEKYHIRALTMDEILSDPEIELVLNLTPPWMHYELNRRCLDAGKHVYSEKMMADDVAQARELMALSREKGVRFAVAPDTFLGGSLQTARYFLDLGIIGTPIMGVIRLTRSYQLTMEDRKDAPARFSLLSRGGGIPYDMSGYYLHGLFNMFGPVARACGFSYTTGGERPYLNPRHSRFNETYIVDTENAVCAALEFKNGFHATMAMTSDCNGSAGNTFEIHGTEGSLILDTPNLFNAPLYYHKAGSERLEFPITHPYGDGSYRGIAAADMAWAIRCNRPHRLSAEMGFHALEVMQGILESTGDGMFRSFDTEFDRPVPLQPIRWGGTTDERSLFLYEN